MSTTPQPQAPAEGAQTAYDKIDRFLRNNLNDGDYADYSASLDILSTPAGQAPAPAQEPVTCQHDWQDFYTGPNRTHLICSKCEKKVPLLPLGRGPLRPTATPQPAPEPVGWLIGLEHDPLSQHTLWNRKPSDDELAFMRATSGGGNQLLKVQPVYLATPQPTQKPAPGQRLVPEDPTPEQEDAAMRAITACEEDFRDEDARRDFRVSYRAAVSVGAAAVATALVYEAQEPAEDAAPLLDALEDLVANVTEAMKTGGWVPTPLHQSFWHAVVNANGAIEAARQDQQPSGGKE